MRHRVCVETGLEDVFRPRVEGVQTGFLSAGELYPSEVFDEDVRALMRSDYAFREENFFSAARAVEGRMFSRGAASHDPGANIVAWAKRARRSALTYLQCGDGPTTYCNRNYRRFVENALRWAASADALAGARDG